MGLFLTDDLIEEIVDRTNSYSRRTINNARSLRKKPRINTWKPTNVDEMNKFIGLLFYMGILHLPKISDYWSTKMGFRNDLLKSAMSRHRFINLLRYWHFVGDGEQNHRLSKINLLLDHLNDTMKTIYTVTRRVNGALAR